MARCIAAAFLTAAWLLPLAGGQMRIPEASEDLVVDTAGLLDAAQAERVREVTRPLMAAGTPVVVLTVKSLAEWGVKQDRIGPFANAVYNAWGIGQTDNRGALLVVSKDDRKLWIAVGRTWARFESSVLPSIIQEAIVPKFKSGDHAGGILAGVTAVRDRVVRKEAIPRRPDVPPLEANPDPAPTPSSSPSPSPPSPANPVPIAPSGPVPGIPGGANRIFGETFPDPTSPGRGGNPFGGGSFLCLAIGGLLALLFVGSIFRRLGGGGGWSSPRVGRRGFGYRRYGRPGWGGVVGGLAAGWMMNQMLGGHRRDTGQQQHHHHHHHDSGGGGWSSPSPPSMPSGGFDSSFGGGVSSGGGAGGSW